MDNYKDRILSLKPRVYWTLNELGGNTVHDETGTHNLVDSTTAPAFQKESIVKGSTSADFSNDSRPNKAAAIGDNLSTGSVEIWFKTVSADTVNACFSLGTGHGASNSYIMFFLESGRPKYQLFYLSTLYQRYASTTTRNDGKWHHWVIVKDSSEIRHYIDGELDATAANASWLNIFAASDIKLAGATISVSDEWYWDGQLDHVAIYEQVLTPQEIRENYRVGVTEQSFDLTQLSTYLENKPTNYYLENYGTPAATKPTGEVTVDWSHPFTDGLLASYDFISGERLNSDSGGNYHGTIVGTTVYKERDVLISGDDANNHRIDLGSYANTHPWNFPNGGTIITRVKLADSPSAGAASRVIDRSSGSAGTGGWAIMYVSDTNQWKTQAKNNAANDTTVTDANADNQWRTLIFRVDPVDRSASYRLDVYDDNFNFVGGSGSTLTSYIPATTTPVSVAIANWNHTTDRNWQGEISYIHVFDKPMAIEDALARAKNPYAYLKSANEPQFVYSLEELPPPTTGATIAPLAFHHRQLMTRAL
jgi:hypothetical protein